MGKHPGFLLDNQTFIESSDLQHVLIHRENLFPVGLLLLCQRLGVLNDALREV